MKLSADRQAKATLNHVVKPSELLYLVRKVLYRQQIKICSALRWENNCLVVLYGKDADPAYDEVMGHVEKSLYPYRSLEEWLVANQYARDHDVLESDLDKLHRTRLAWVNWMIKHYKAKGQ